MVFRFNLWAAFISRILKLNLQSVSLFNPSIIRVAYRFTVRVFIHTREFEFCHKAVN